MQLEEKKIKIIAQSFGIEEDLVKSILDSYMALTLYNILTYVEDDTTFGVMSLDKENRKLKIIDNSEYINKIFNGNVDADVLKRFIMLGNNNI